MTEDHAIGPPLDATVDEGDGQGTSRSVSTTSPTSVTSTVTPAISPTNTTSRLSARFKSLTFSFGGGKRSPTPSSSNAQVGSGTARADNRDSEGSSDVGQSASASTSTTSLHSASVSAFGSRSGSGGDASSMMTSISGGSSDIDLAGRGEVAEERSGEKGTNQSPTHFQEEGMKTPSALQPNFDVPHRPPFLSTTSPPKSSSSGSLSSSSLTSPSPSKSDHPSSLSLRTLSPRHLNPSTLLDDITPRAELPPGLGRVVATSREEGGKKISPLKGEPDATNLNDQATSRNGTIKRRSPLPEFSPTASEHPRSAKNTTINNNNRSTSRDSYFPSLDEIDTPSCSESSGDSTVMESRRPSAPTDSEISPLSTEPENGGIDVNLPGKKQKHQQRKLSDNEPWPSSSRHGPTPLGFGGLGRLAALSPADVGGENAILSSNSSGTGMSMMNNNSASWADKTLKEYSYATHEDADTFASGCEVSIPLSPPAGYPVMGRPIGGHGGASVTQRTSGSGWGSSPSSGNASPVTSPSVDGGPGPRGSASSSYSASSGISEPRLSIGSLSSGFSFDPSGIPPDTPPEVLSEPIHNQGPNTFEGTITIDTNPKRYLISAKLEGFRVEDITIAVKSVSTASRSSVSSQTSVLSDAGSTRSAVSSRSLDRGKTAFAAARGSIPEEGDPLQGIAGLASSEVPRAKAGKVLHLLADRWDDSGE